MGVLSGALRDGVVGDSIRSSNGGKQTTVGKVLASDESSNLCEVEYVNTSGSKQKLKNVMVDLRNTDWFPEEGETVLLSLSGKSGLILSKYTEDYNKDIGNARQTKNDNSNDGADWCCGGSLF